DLPYLVRDRGQLKHLVESVVLPQMSSKARQSGIELLALFDGEFHQINSRKPLASLADFRGLRIATSSTGERISSSYYRPVNELFYRVGAEPVAVTSNDVDSRDRAEWLDAADISLIRVLASRSSQSFP